MWKQLDWVEFAWMGGWTGWQFETIKSLDLAGVQAAGLQPNPLHPGGGGGRK